jgi:hypothetical protein
MYYLDFMLFLKDIFLANTVHRFSMNGINLYWVFHENRQICRWFYTQDFPISCSVLASDRRRERYLETFPYFSFIGVHWTPPFLVDLVYHILIEISLQQFEFHCLGHSLGVRFSLSLSLSCLRQFKLCCLYFNQPESLNWRFLIFWLLYYFVTLLYNFPWDIFGMSK